MSQDRRTEFEGRLKLLNILLIPGTVSEESSKRRVSHAEKLTLSRS